LTGSAQFVFHLLYQHIYVCKFRAYLLVDFRAIKLLNFQNFAILEAGTDISIDCF